MTDLALPFSRRNFLANASCFGAFYAAARLIPLPVLAAELADDSRVSQAPIGDGLYATISDPSKGFTTLSNAGFLVGKDAAFLLEGFASSSGAALQMDALRTVSQVPVKAAMNTHYHFDHAMGNAYYGANGVPLWGHAEIAKRIIASYGPMQGVNKDVALASYEKRVRDAKSDLERQHAQGDLAALTGIFQIASSTVLSVPNHPIDPARLPMTIDLGGLSAVLESYPGHSGTDIIVRVSAQNVIYTGDLLFHGWYPVVFDEKATVSGWRETLKKFASFDKDTLFVPGHGQVCGQEGVTTIRAVFDDVAEWTEKMYKTGVPIAEAQHRYVIPERFKNEQVYCWGFTVQPIVTKLYAEWQGK